MNSKFWIAWIFISLSGAPTLANAAPRFVITDLGDLPGGLNSSSAMALNSYGQVVGTSVGEGGSRPFIWTPTSPNGTSGSMTDLKVLPGFPGMETAYGINTFGQIAAGSRWNVDLRALLWSPATPNSSATGSAVEILRSAPNPPTTSEAGAINSMGQVTGRIETSNGTRAFLWTPEQPNTAHGSYVDLGPLPDGYDSSGTAINDIGQVIGYGNKDTGPYPFLWTPTTNNGSTGSMVNLGDLTGGDNFSMAWGINSRGQVVGGSSAAAGMRAFLWTPDTPNGTTGSMVSLGNLPASQVYDDSFAYGINSQGQVVGYSIGREGMRAFLWVPSSLNGMSGEMLQLDTLIESTGTGRWSLDVARGINDFGQIVGYGWYDPDGAGGAIGYERGFLLTPVPEPTSAGLLVMAGLAACCRFRRRR